MNRSQIITDALKRRKIFVFTDSDLDGTGSRIVIEFYFNLLGIKPSLILQTSTNKVENDFRKKTNLDLDDIAFEDTTIIFCDCIAEPYQMKSLISKSNVLIFDHHKTSRENLPDFPGYFYDESMSSCKNVYTSLLDMSGLDNPALEEFVELVDTYDLWKDYTPLFEQAIGLNNVLFSMVGRARGNTEAGFTDFVNRQLKKFDVFERFKFLQSELKIIDKEKKAFEEDVKKISNSISFRVDGNGNRYAYFKCSRRASQLAAFFLNRYPELSYVVLNNTYIKTENKMSVRSKGFAVKSIAEKYGGGGHLLASGFVLDKHTFAEFDSGLIHLI